ncbi:MAG: condensation domain-containing protein, partial [Blastocatellia bacterium]
MTTIELLTTLRKLNIRIKTKGDQLNLSAPRGALTQALREELSKHKAEIIRFLRDAGAVVQTASLPLVPVARDRRMPLSFAQQRLWFMDRFESGNIAYNVSEAISVKGAMNAPGLQQSLGEIARRHEVLRTTYEAIDGEPVLVIAPPGPLPLCFVDLTGLSEEIQQRQAGRLAELEAKRPFVLAEGPMLRSGFVQTNRQHHIILFSMHHIVSDLWSMDVLVREVSTLYGAFSAGEPSPLRELPVQYADYAYWQRQWLQGSVLDEQIDYWRGQLKPPLPALRLQTDRPRPEFETLACGRHSFAVGSDTAASLRGLANKTDATLFMVLLAAFKALLYCYTGQMDVVLATQTAGRNRIETEGLIGFFINQLILRTDLSGDPTFRELVERVREVTLGAFAHQDLPFDKLIEEIQPERTDSRVSLTDIVFGLQTIGHSASANASPGVALQTTPMASKRGRARTDLILLMQESGEKIGGLFEYNTDLFDESTIVGIEKGFQIILDHFAANPDHRISVLPPLPGQLSSTADMDVTQPDHLEELYNRSNLSMDQLLFWLGQKLLPQSPLFNTCVIFTLMGEVDLNSFHMAFQAVLDSSDIMRTVIEERDGVPYQSVREHLAYVSDYVDLSQAPDPAVEFQRWGRERIIRRLNPIDCLFDSALVKISDQEHRWFLNQHHSICDAWSFELSFERLTKFYKSAQEGRAPEILDYPSFAEYLIDERTHHNSERYREAEEYWKQKLSRKPDVLDFYGQGKQPQSNNVLRISHELDERRSELLRTASSSGSGFMMSGEAAMSTTFLALLCTFLHRISGARHLSIGVAVHNRRTKRHKQAIGLFMHFVPLQIEILYNDTFATLIKKVSEELLRALRYGSYSVPNSFQHPAYEVLFNSITVSYPDFLGEPVDTQWMHPGEGAENLALHVHHMNSFGKIVLEFDFQCDIFDERKRRQAISNFLQIIDAFGEDRNQPIRRVSLLSAAERQRILFDYNETSRPYPVDRTYRELFQTQVETSPDRIAVTSADGCLSYSQLSRRADLLASHIASLGIFQEKLVAIYSLRSLD